MRFQHTLLLRICACSCNNMVRSLNRVCCLIVISDYYRVHFVPESSNANTTDGPGSLSYQFSAEAPVMLYSIVGRTRGVDTSSTVYAIAKYS